MKKCWVVAFCFANYFCYAQIDTANKILRAFPIADYIIDDNDSITIVQLEMPEQIKLNAKQFGLIYGVFNNSNEETIQKGYGQCHLIKGNYYYFGIKNNTSGLGHIKGDLLYTFMGKTNIYDGLMPKLAAHFIRLKDVYDQPFYDRYLIFQKWTENEERTSIESMVKDIQFTGQYFIKNEPAIDKDITTGKFAGITTLSVMKNCKKEDLINFLNYIIYKPRIYAGQELKISEIFATWISEGTPEATLNIR